MLHHTRQTPDQPSAEVGKEIWELKVSDAFIFRGNQQFWLPSLWVHLRAASAELGSRGCSYLLFWKSRPLEAFQVGKREWVALPLLKTAAQEYSHAWSPEAPWPHPALLAQQHPPETEGCQAPRAVMGHSSCVAALPVSPVGCIQGWDGLEWVAVRWNPV